MKLSVHPEIMAEGFCHAQNRFSIYRGILFASLAFALVICPGCGRSPGNTLQDLDVNLVWPSPPEKARIKYLYSIAKPEDIGWSPSFFEKAFRIFAGAKAPRQIVRPLGIFCSRDETLYVADPGIRLVHKFDLQARRYEQIRNYDKQDFLSPVGVVMDEQDNLYISDSMLQRIFVFTPGSKPLLAIGAKDQLLRPTGIAIHPLLKRLYVADTTAHSIKAFDLKGNFLYSIGRRGNGQGEFNFPTSLAIDQDGKLFVNDSLNFRIQAFGPDGEFLFLFGKHGDGMGEFSQPKGLAFDRENNIYVTDAIFDAVQIFNHNGDLLLSFGEAGQQPGQFWIPTSIFIDQTNRIFVSDSYNQRVQVFKFLGGSGL